MVSRSMKTTPAMACMKTLLAVFTLIFLIIGLAVFGFGIYAKCSLQAYLTLSSIDYTNGPFVMIAVGAFITVVGLLGCCATFKNNTCLLRTYGTLLAFVFIVEFVGAIMALVYRTKLDAGFKSGTTYAVRNYTSDDSAQTALDNVQKTLKCCGSNNYTDYTNVGWVNAVPYSCGINATDSNTKNITIDGEKFKDLIYTQGCYTLVSKKVKANLAVIIGSMFGVAFFQVFGLLLACCLASTINSNKYELV